MYYLYTRTYLDADACTHAGVGENPEYMRKKKQREARKQAKKEAKMVGKRAALAANGGEDVDLGVLFGDETTDSWSDMTTTTEWTE